MIKPVPLYSAAQLDGMSIRARRNYESRLRREVRAAGFRLQKCRTKNPRDAAYRKWLVLDAQGQPALNPHPRTVADIAARYVTDSDIAAWLNNTDELV
jgi:hypothetical protein